MNWENDPEKCDDQIGDCTRIINMSDRDTTIRLINKLPTPPGKLSLNYWMGDCIFI